ncbi:hypothetical protein GM658_06700 [Pseudoduganella eburnea]|uniref:Uncharacterized protein n=1 Tax=Massilia eburnea TaxID=1776165 RepID=A0A6L6QDM1_9BURK|nr:hypothetical protein [Massilia eburnea]MTW10290.1 hypothetical protein [Massilia eburnea]
MEDVTTTGQAKPSRKWVRIAIYIFAAVGLLFSALIAVMAFRHQPESPHTIDANDAISELMTRNYGKYSESQRGWLYVDEENHATYLVTVIQQKKVDGKEGDELYLVASGRTIESRDGQDSFYGVFQLRYSGGQLYEYSDVRRSSGTDPVTPERVHFEALSGDVWGWVVKVSDNATGDGEESINTRNVVLAPHNEQIAVLGEFNAAFQVLGAGGCEETEHRYAEWKQAMNDKKSLKKEEGTAGEATAEVEDDGEDFEPPRCTRLQWTYRTDPVADATFTPLYITRKPGMQEGVQREAKTWKVMFDPKSYTYLLPDELKNQGM